MQHARTIEIVRSKYPKFNLRSFSAANLQDSPLLFLGTFSEGETTGRREAFRICLVLADLKTGKIAAKVTTRTYMDRVDRTPTPYFRDSPAWMKEATTDGYIAACQGNTADRLESSYLAGMPGAALVSPAITTYDSGRYREALNLFADALNTAAGNHLLIYNGLYLTNLRLGRPAAANEISSKLVEYALTHKRLAIKFPFKPGTTAYSADQISGSYWMWLKQIARHTARSNACLEITGHSSATGAETLNERLSQLRAEYVKKQLERQSPRLRGRLLPAVLALAKIYWGPAKTI
jgi:hypothetical protein